MNTKPWPYGPRIGHIEIIRNGEVVQRSKNLRAIRSRASEKGVAVVSATAVRCTKNPYNGVLSVKWDDGSYVETLFADFGILKEWMHERRAWKGKRQIEDGEAF